MKNLNKQAGFSLIEILIGLAIFAIIFVGVSYLLMDNLQASFDNQEKIKADFLVAEGLEAVKAIAGNDWDQIKPGTYGLKLVDNQWQLVADSEQVTQMSKQGERTITIFDVQGDNLKKVESKVVWLNITDKLKQVSAATLLTNWRNYVSVCADGLDNDGDGKADYPDDPGCDSPDDEDEINPVNPPELPICSDGKDNDGDRNIDYPNDPGCSSASDDDETDPPVLPVCSDGLDNDSDGNTDYPNDPGCCSADDDDETDPLNPPQCSDGLDNDGDGNIDFPNDPGCDSADDDDETQVPVLPICSDGLDNDADGNIDYPDDPGCESEDDNDEINPQKKSVCSDGIDNDTDGNIDYPNDPGCDSADDDDEVNNDICGNGIIEASEECDTKAANNCKNTNESCFKNCQCKVPICHVTSSETNPYEMIWVNYSAVDGEGNNDHSHHIGDIIPIGDVNNDGTLDDDDCLATDKSEKVVTPDVIFDAEDTPLCKLDQGTITVTGKVILPENKTANLQLSYYVAWPENKRTEIVYVNKGLVENGATFSLIVPWTGVAKKDIRVETHVGATLIDGITGNSIMANSSSLDYYWYPWVCPAPKPQCSDTLDNDNDSKIDFPADEDCVSADDDNEGTNNCGISSNSNYDYTCHYDNEDDEIQVKIKNNNDRGFSDTALSLPTGIIPLLPLASEIYQGVVGTYSVEITNNPFYSIKFNNAGAEGFKNSAMEMFVLTFSPADYNKIEELKVYSKAALIIGNVIFNLK